MPRYLLAVVRTTYYEIEAAAPARVWDAYLDLPEVDDDMQETEGHYVCALDEAGQPVGGVLYAEGDLVPEIEAAP